MLAYTKPAEKVNGQFRLRLHEVDWTGTVWIWSIFGTDLLPFTLDWSQIGPGLHDVASGPVPITGASASFLIYGWHLSCASLSWNFLTSLSIRTNLDRIRVFTRQYAGSEPNWNGTVPNWITFASGLIWYRIADPFHTWSTRCRVNKGPIRTNFVSVPNGSDLV